MAQFRESVVGQTIHDVTFCELSSGLSVTLHFDGGEHLDLTVVEQAFSLHGLRDRYGHVVEREYYVDFPERRLRG